MAGSCQSVAREWPDTHKNRQRVHDQNTLLSLKWVRTGRKAPVARRTVGKDDEHAP